LRALPTGAALPDFVVPIDARESLCFLQTIWLLHPDFIAMILQTSEFATCDL